MQKQDDNLARAAVERSMSSKTVSENFRQQVEDQKTQVENLKTALVKLGQKLAEAKSKSDMLIAQHRRSRALGRATDAGRAMGDNSNAAAFDRMKNKVQHSEATAMASSELAADNVDDKFAALEKQDEVERLLSELKTRLKAG